MIHVNSPAPLLPSPLQHNRWPAQRRPPSPTPSPPPTPSTQSPSQPPELPSLTGFPFTKTRSWLTCCSPPKVWQPCHGRNQEEDAGDEGGEGQCHGQVRCLWASSQRCQGNQRILIFYKCETCANLIRTDPLQFRDAPSTDSNVCRSKMFAFVGKLAGLSGQWWQGSAHWTQMVLWVPSLLLICTSNSLARETHYIIHCRLQTHAPIVEAKFSKNIAISSYWVGIFISQSQLS